MYHVHFGVKGSDMPLFARALFSVGAGAIVDGDGWHAWGERLGNAGNALDILHVVVPVETLGLARTVLTVVPKTEPYHGPGPIKAQGRLWFITTAEDWTEDVDFPNSAH